MYNEYFGFKESPFSIAPDPRYLYMTSQHRDALAHLIYGLNSEGGCILLTGEVGTGKTTICRCLLEQMPAQSNVALVLNPKVSEIELLETICDELKINYPADNNSVKTYTDRIYKFLISSNQKNEKTVLIIDEAQNLDSKVLEQLRLLTNLETNKRKLLQIIILGQPELLEILAKKEMRQLAQRITARFHLQPLKKHEVKAYLSHRLAVAGQNVQLFPDKSIKLLFRLSDGIPRLINIISDRALLGAYVEDQPSVNPAIVTKAAKEVFGELKNVEKHQQKQRWLFSITTSAAIIASVAFFTIVTLFYLNNTNEASATNTLGLSLEQNTDDPKATIDIPLANNDTDKLIAPSPDTTKTTATLHALVADKQSVLTSQTYFDDLDEILDQEGNNPASAYHELFKIWHLQYDKNTKPTACQQAIDYSLYCLHTQGNITNLKNHNRPAILTLTNKKGGIRYITIASINDEQATIHSRNNIYTIKLSELNKYWHGQFVLLWQKPKHYLSAIVPGDSGIIINWLHKKIMEVTHEPAGDNKTTYTNFLAEKIITFQEKQGLSADGIVGPVTIIHLNTIADANIPTLIKAATPSLPPELSSQR